MTEREKYNIEGMTCAACVAHVDKAVRSIKGVKEVNVNLLTNSMTVSYDEGVTPSLICSAVSKAGYKANVSNINKNNYVENDDLEDKETPKLVKILIISSILLIPLFYISMGYMLMEKYPNWPLGIFKENPLIMGLSTMLLSLSIMIINKRFFISGFKSLFHGSANMDSLVALGSGTAFIYSTILMFIMCFYAIEGNLEKVMLVSMNLSFETAGMVPTLITIGKTLESYSKGKTTNAIKSLLDLEPKTARVIRNDIETIIDSKDVLIGDTFIVKVGETFPVDGVILDGFSSVDESMLTGESIPVDKTVGSKVSCGTINKSGLLKCKATNVGNETTINKIVEMVKSASGTKTKISRLADRVAGIFVPVVMIIAAIVFTIWLFSTNYNISTSLERGISVLVISCPCALGLATPVAIMVGSGKSAKSGILFKNALALEETGKINFAVLDKTGTITKGKPVVTDIYPIGITKEELLVIASSIEKNSEHPLSVSIVNKANELNIKVKSVTNFEVLPGIGVKGYIEDKLVVSGNSSILSNISDEILKISTDYSNEGKTPLFFLMDNKLIGIIAVRDEIKEDSKEAIRLFEKYGVKTIMLTGDNNKTANAIAKEVGISYVISDVLPIEKQNRIKKLKKYGKVLMIGDGINDAVALTEADLGMAIGKGSDIAVESANVVLMKSSLIDAVAAYNLSRNVYLNIIENLFWAFIYNLIMIPFAATASMKPWMGAAAMSLSSFCVVMNALRINLFNPYKERRQKVSKISTLDFLKTDNLDDKNTKTIDIEGMMCEMCVKHVSDALKNLKGVSDVYVSLENNNAVVKVDKDVKDKLLSKAIKEAGYKVTRIK